ncbi:MAG: hypothetical protein KC800_30410 [Candidatus Eremiobacteraeota bacterium]|nr:hypothetical protein [Candidatus Eremiobacteraeota bacterium]
MGSSISGIGKWFHKQFNRPQGKDFLSSGNDIDISEVGTKAGIGGGAGLAVGAGIGMLVAQNEISKVPVEQVTHDYRVPVTQREELGLIPSDKYTPAYGWRNGFGLRWNFPSDTGVPTESVYRDNPVYNSAGEVHMQHTSQTFSGHGRPMTEWVDTPIKHHTMNGYNHSATPDIEQVFDHTEYWTESEPYTVYTNETEYFQNCVDQYNSDGSTSQDCYTDSRTVSVGHTEYRDVERSRDVYRDELRGYYERYSPNINSRTVGTYKVPKVTFDHGVSVGSYVMKGVLIGAGLGALALGVASVISQRSQASSKPGPSPAPKPDPKPDPNPAPKPDPKPVPAPEPAPYYGDVKNHAHDGRRHSHAGGDRWHFHGCPDDGRPAFNNEYICFKPDQVPSGYKEDEKVDCGANGSVCYVQKGAGSAHG